MLSRFSNLKHFSAFTVLLICLSLLAACSTNNSQQTSQTPQEAGTSNASSGSKTNSAPKELTTLEEISKYLGSDREQRLAEAAKKEETLSIYTASPIEDMKKLTQEFEKKYGVKTTIWRSSTENLLQRIITEEKSGKHNFDIVTGASSNLEALYRENLLQQVESPQFKDIMPNVIPKHKQWGPIYLTIFVQTYNTKAVKKDELPKKYQDLLQPKWKGRLGIEATDADWFMAVVKQMGEQQGLQYFKDFAAMDVSVRSGHSLLAELVANGEVPYAMTVYSYKARQLKEKGAPVDWHYLEPGAIARSTGEAISKNAPHPNAAVLFYDFLLGEGQKILASMSYDPTNIKYQKVNIPALLVNDADILDESEKWIKLFDEIIIKKSK